VVAFLLLSAVGVQGAEPTPQQQVDGLKILDAVLGDTPRDGACMSSGYFFLLRSNPKKLSRLIAREGSAGQLSDGAWVAPDAMTLAARLGGEVIVEDGDLAYVLIVDGAGRRVDEFMRFASSEGDVVWFLIGSHMKEDCGASDEAALDSPAPDESTPAAADSGTAREAPPRRTLRGCQGHY
jgi:hypothetical protein